MSLEKIEGRESPFVVGSFAGGIKFSYLHCGQPRRRYSRFLAFTFEYASTPFGSYLAVSNCRRDLGRRGVMVGHWYGT